MSLAIGVTGASGFLGRSLAAFLAARGDRVTRFVRGRRAGTGEIAWDPLAGQLDECALEPLDGIVHLSGAGIADERWTLERRRLLVDSRVRSTATLARALAACAKRGARPRVLVSASAVGWYGDRGDEPLDERSGPGRGFLAELAQAWEAAAAPARDAGVRVAHPRTGLVLSPDGGVLAKLLLPFRLGAGGPLGDGRAWWSWIALSDWLDAVGFALEAPALAGAFNAVAPEPVRQGDFARTLGRALHRPAFMPAPALALRAIMGRGRADEMLLASQRALPHALTAAGFRFREPELARLLARLLAPPVTRARPSARGS